MKITDLRIREIFDSRGTPTVEAEIHTARGAFRGAAPAGKSTGSREAKAVPPDRAGRILAGIKRPLLKKSFKDQKSFDRCLDTLDGTSDKSRLGGNITLAFSLAFARAMADEHGLALWTSLRREFWPELKQKIRYPLIFSNLINGGAHARNNLNIQEYMVVAEPGGSVLRTVKNLIEFYGALRTVLLRREPKLAIGDEGGFDLKFKNNFEPIAVLEKLIRVRRLEHNFKIALDAAATGFREKEGYRFEGSVISQRELLRHYLDYFRRSKLLISLEDPFGEDDRAGFFELMNRTKEWIVGDDLTTTDRAAIAEAAEEKLIRAVIIKPNQIGSVTETADAIRAAQTHRLGVILSHRSGETEDCAIVHLARASNADALKIGAPARERMLKFNETLRIYG